MLFTLLLSLLSGPVSAAPYSPNLLLRQLPESAVLHVKNDIQLEETSYDDVTLHHTGFENGEQIASADVTGLGSALNSQAIIRTNTYSSLQERSVSKLFYNSSAYFLLKGRYCLSKSESRFDSHLTGLLSNSRDYLFFRRCDSGEAAFVIYAIAGYNLRNSDGYRGINIHQFDFQTGRAVEFVR